MEVAGASNVLTRPDGSHVLVPHVDLIVIIANIKNLDVERVYLDTGANSNVLFGDLLGNIRVKRFLLTPSLEPMFGVGKY